MKTSALVTTIKLPFWQRVKMLFFPRGLMVSVSFDADKDKITVGEITADWV